VKAEEIFALEFMRRYQGDIFAGFISGVAPLGFFVELKDYPVEGLVRIGQLDDDYYDLDEEYSIWRGRRSGRTLGLGDPATVMIERIDVLAGQMDLILLRERGGKKKKGKASRRLARPRAAEIGSRQLIGFMHQCPATRAWQALSFYVYRKS